MVHAQNHHNRATFITFIAACLTSGDSPTRSIEKATETMEKLVAYDKVREADERNRVALENAKSLLGDMQDAGSEGNLCDDWFGMGLQWESGEHDTLVEFTFSNTEPLFPIRGDIKDLLCERFNLAPQYILNITPDPFADDSDTQSTLGAESDREGFQFMLPYPLRDKAVA